MDVQPVSVSQCSPIYINGRLKHWTVRVVYAGDLCLYRPDEELRNNPILRKSLMGEPLYFEIISTVLDPKIYIPNRGRINTVKYNNSNNTTTLGYGWRNDLLGIGAKRAQKFRLKMLEKTNERQKA